MPPAAIHQRQPAGHTGLALGSHTISGMTRYMLFCSLVIGMPCSQIYDRSLLTLIVLDSRIWIQSFCAQQRAQGVIASSWSQVHGLSEENHEDMHFAYAMAKLLKFQTQSCHLWLYDLGGGAMYPATIHAAEHIQQSSARWPAGVPWLVTGSSQRSAGGQRPPPFLNRHCLRACHCICTVHVRHGMFSFTYNRVMPLVGP